MCNARDARQQRAGDGREKLLLVTRRVIITSHGGVCRRIFGSGRIGRTCLSVGSRTRSPGGCGGAGALAVGSDPRAP
eukprot:536404-Pyramimonas_sp.AAC.1